MIPLKDTIRARGFSIVNWGLIAANVGVFLVTTWLTPRQQEWLILALGVVPARLLGHLDIGQALTLLTSQFLHGGWFHLISNMWALYIFGDNVEDCMGSRRYLAFYLLSGVVAGLAQSFLSPNSNVPMVGASGAIAGVLGAYLVLFPRSQVITLVPVFLFPWFVQIPAVLYLFLWFVSQLFSGLFALAAADVVGMYGGVAWWAHVGGFVTGLVLARVLARRGYNRCYADEIYPW